MAMETQVRQSYMCACFRRSESSLRPRSGYAVLFWRLVVVYKLFDASTRSLAVVNFGGEMRRIRPSHWSEAVGFGLGLDISTKPHQLFNQP
jgi:hypothetical protein